MALTRDFKKTVKARAERDPAFRDALLNEAVTLGSNNIFADLGLPEAGALLAKAGMIREIRHLISTLKLTPSAAAKQLGMKQADLAELLNGPSQDYSADRLTQMLSTLGLGKTRAKKRALSKFVIGRERFAQISVVEGIKPTAEMKERTEKFEREGLSAAERRREIIKAHRKG